MRLRRSLGVAAASAGLLVAGLAAATEANASNVTVANCPAGAVCLYSGTDLNGSVTAEGGPFYTYDDHALYGVTGNHSYANNQVTDGGLGGYSWTCTHANGVGCSHELYSDSSSPMQYVASVNMTPINYIRLEQHPS